MQTDLKLKKSRNIIKIVCNIMLMLIASQVSIWNRYQDDITPTCPMFLDFIRSQRKATWKPDVQLGADFCSFVDADVDHDVVTAADTTTGDYQITIMDETTTITMVTDPEPKYISELPPVSKNEAKTREYSHQGSSDYHDGLLEYFWFPKMVSINDCFTRPEYQMLCTKQYLEHFPGLKMIK